jgi:FlaA1/EpsC-like NDP-sugar epimerase
MNNLDESTILVTGATGTGGSEVKQVKQLVSSSSVYNAIRMNVHSQDK